MAVIFIASYFGSSAENLDEQRANNKHSSTALFKETIQLYLSKREIMKKCVATVAISKKHRIVFRN